jgi:hypothetical protein
MKAVMVSSRSKTMISLLKRARRGGLILRSPDGYEFILAEVDDFDREIELTRKNKKLMEFLDHRASQTKTLTSAEVRAELGLK